VSYGDVSIFVASASSNHYVRLHVAIHSLCCIGKERTQKARDVSPCVALCLCCGLRQARNEPFFASKAVNKVRRETTEETTNKQRRRRLTLICCLRDVALDHAGIDAAMDEGLLQLPQVGGRRLEVPAQAVAHRAHQSSPVSASSSYSRAAAAICSEKATQAR
jgi:hypothetical protein